MIEKLKKFICKVSAAVSMLIALMLKTAVIWALQTFAYEYLHFAAKLIIHSFLVCL